MDRQLVIDVTNLQVLLLLRIWSICSGRNVGEAELGEGV